MKDIIFKQIDILRDEVKWWRNMFLITISTLIGGIVSFSQNKLELNFVEAIVGVFLIIGFIYSILKLKLVQKEQQKLFDKIRRDKWKS